MRFTSTKYPQLVVYDLGITFVDGEADVMDKEVAAALKGLPHELGVRAVGGRPGGLVTKPPSS
jgi:hypothetical protein